MMVSLIREAPTPQTSRIERSVELAEVSQPAMAELSQDGDMSETRLRGVSHIVLCGSEPPRAIISVSKPMAHDVHLLACKADSSLLQAGAGLSQPANKQQSDLSQITK